MTRVKRGTMASKRRSKVLKAVKGYKWRRKSTLRAANQALLKAGKYAYRDRRAKKRTFRSLWILRLSNALKPENLTYSKFIKLLKTKQVELDRKVLSEIAVKFPDTFQAIVKGVQ